MDYGLFTMPSHPPERALYDGHQWDLQQLRWADELGYGEAWVGEHHTAPWEPNPSPDLLVAQALLQTKQIRLGPGGFLLPYHHPAELANRAAMLDHLSQGRLLLGIAAGGLTSERGFIPMSPSLNAGLMASHWTSVDEAARRVGRAADRANWRCVREVLVADTDEEALRWSLDGPIGRQMGEYFLPLLASGNA